MLLNARRGLAIAVSMLAGAVLLGVLVGTASTLRGIQQVDDGTLRLAGEIRVAPLTWFAKLLDVLGGTYVNWPVRAAAVALLIARRRWVQLTAFALAILSSEFLIGFLKDAYDRPRPPGSLVATSGASFPSGHAIAVTVTAVGVVLALLAPGQRRWRWLLRAIGFAFLMGTSRVYLAAHWLSDVVEGSLIGGGLALGWPALLQTIRDRRQAPSVGATPVTPDP